MLAGGELAPASPQRRADKSLGAHNGGAPSCLENSRKGCTIHTGSHIRTYIYYRLRLEGAEESL